MIDPIKANASKDNTLQLEQSLQEQLQVTTTDPSFPHSKRKFRGLISIIKLVILLLVIVWIALQLRKSWTELLTYDWNPQWKWLFASGLFYLGGFFPAALFWNRSLHWLGQKPKLFDSILAYYSSQLGKYVPGKAMVVVIRTNMITSERVKISVATVSVFYETLTMMGAGAFLGALVVFFYFRENAIFSLIALGIAICSITPLLPPLFIRILKKLKVGKNDPNVQEALNNLKYRYLVIGCGLMTILWLFFGLSLWAVILGIGIDPGSIVENLPRYVASVSLATSLGFVVVVSPGGLGVREAILLNLLIPFFSHILENPVNAVFNFAPEALATLVSLLQRIISILAEMTSFITMTFLGFWLKNRKSNKA